MWPLEAMMPFGVIVSVEGSGRKLECTAGRESGGPESHHHSRWFCIRDTELPGEAAKGTEG